MHPSDELELLRASAALYHSGLPRIHQQLPATFSAPLSLLPELTLLGTVEGEGYKDRGPSISIYYRTSLSEDELEPLLMTRFTEQGWRDFQILFPASNGFLGHDEGLDRDRVEQTQLHTLGHPPTRCILSIGIHEEPHETLVMLSSPQGHGQDLHLWGPEPLDFRTPSPVLHAPTGIQVNVLERHQRIQKQDAWGHLAARLTGEEKTGVLHEHFAHQLVAQGWTMGQTSVSEALCSSTWHLTDAVSDVQAVLLLLRLGERDWLARFESARLVETDTVGMSMYG